MTAELAHQAEPLGVGDRLDRVADVGQPGARPDLAIAASSAASVALTSRSASADGATPPTNTVTAESEWNPSQIAPKSSDRRSPSFTTRVRDGIPWTISWFTDAQIVAGTASRRSRCTP